MLYSTAVCPTIKHAARRRKLVGSAHFPPKSLQNDRDRSRGVGHSGHWNARLPSAVCAKRQQTLNKGDRATTGEKHKTVLPL